MLSVFGEILVQIRQTAVKKFATSLATMGTHMPYGITQHYTCRPAEVTFPPLPQSIRLVLDSAILEGCKAELT